MNQDTQTSSSFDFSQKNHCAALLLKLDVSDPIQMCTIFKRLLTGMKNNPPSPLDHLKILESLREKLHFALEQVSQRYASRALPPTSQDNEVLCQVVNLWQTMADNYDLIDQRTTFDEAFSKRHSLLAQRRMLYSVLVGVEYFRARRTLPALFWHKLHTLFLAAERVGVADVRVSDPLDETWGAQSAQQVYIAMLLIEVAGPYNRTPKEFTWICRWAQRFAPYCVIQKKFVDEPFMYALDTQMDKSLQSISLIVKSHKNIRGLSTAKLASHIRGIVTQLKKGKHAASLGLGQDCVQPECARLLVVLYRLWGMAAAGRKFRRRPARGKVRLLLDPYGIAFFIDKQEFSAPVDQNVSSFSRLQSLQLFGERADSTPVEVDEVHLIKRATQLGFAPEIWHAADQSMTGCRLERKGPGASVDHRQMVGLYRPGGEGVLLAEICWQKYKEEGALEMGIRVMPGHPKVVAIRRQMGVVQGNEPYQLGFLLVTTHTPSLIVPSGWYAQGRMLTLCEGSETSQIMFDKLLSHCSTFDRVSFTPQP